MSKIIPKFHCFLYNIYNNFKTLQIQIGKKVPKRKILGTTAIHHKNAYKPHHYAVSDSIINKCGAKIECQNKIFLAPPCASYFLTEFLPI